MKPSHSVLVAGAGQAGAEAVRRLRARGYAGALTLIGDEGAVPYHRPPLSKGYLGRTVSPQSLDLRPSDFWRSLDVLLILDDPVAAIDRDRGVVHLGSGKILGYDQLLLATGARSRRIAIDGASGGDHLFCLRTRADADRLGEALTDARHLTIIGGGYIGLEVASQVRGAGVEVCIVERAERVLARVTGVEVSAWYEAMHRDKGVEIICNARVVEMYPSDDQRYRLRLADGSGLVTDVVLCGVGAVPNVELACDAALECADGIVVDAVCRTGDPAVYAAGDCAIAAGGDTAPMRIESVWNAINQADRAAAHMLNQAPPVFDVPWFWSDQYDVRLQTAGVRDHPDMSVVRGDPARGRFSVFSWRSGYLQAVDSVNDPASFMAVKQILKLGGSIDPALAADTAMSMKAILAEAGGHRQERP